MWWVIALALAAMEASISAERGEELSDFRESFTTGRGMSRIWKTILSRSSLSIYFSLDAFTSCWRCPRTSLIFELIFYSSINTEVLSVFLALPLDKSLYSTFSSYPLLIHRPYLPSSLLYFGFTILMIHVQVMKDSLLTRSEQFRIISESVLVNASLPLSLWVICNLRVTPHVTILFNRGEMWMIIQ